MHETRQNDAPIAAANPGDERYRYISFFDDASFAVSPPRRPLPRESRSDRASADEAGLLEPETAAFLSWLLGQAGVDRQCYRDAPLARRLRACLRRLRCRSVAEAWTRLEQEPADIPAAISVLLIGVTEFFRDRSVFGYLDEVVLPRLAADRAGLRVWSVGCADGAELYSVAMLLARHGLLEHCWLRGTDCRADAVVQAQRGWYESSRLGGLDASLREAFFVRERGGWRVGEALRSATEWGQESMLADSPVQGERWDLILCRNVAIYFQPAASARLWTRLANALRSGGVLVLGKAERPGGQDSLARLGPCVFIKRE
jgi:chemotaxis methyl-accepting protein methylase